MKFTRAAMTLLLFAGQASAWTTAARPLSRRVLATQFHSTTTSIATEIQGKEDTESFRLKFKEGDKTLSPWHDITLKNDDGSYNMVRETCRRLGAPLWFYRNRLES